VAQVLVDRGLSSFAGKFTAPPALILVKIVVRKTTGTQQLALTALDGAEAGAPSSASKVDCSSDNRLSIYLRSSLVSTSPRNSALVLGNVGNTPFGDDAPAVEFGNEFAGASRFPRPGRRLTVRSPVLPTAQIDGNS
jgi:hypothetical protein